MKRSRIFLTMSTCVLAIGAFVAVKAAAKRSPIFYCTSVGNLASNAHSCLTKNSAPIGAVTCHTGTRTLYTCAFALKKVVLVGEGH